MSRLRLAILRRSIPLLTVLLLPASSAHAFACLQINGHCVHWTPGAATVRSFLGSSPPLMNGSLSWDQNTIAAANDWNAVGAAFRYAVTTGGQFNDPCGAPGGGHACFNTGPVGDNPVFFASSFCGQQFGDIIELTNNCADSSSGAMLNAPVFVNGNVAWDAYDGCIRNVQGSCARGGDAVVYDIRRVLLHELGHVLGLDHPDEHGQIVVAIMNSRVSDLDRLQPDDVAGVQFLYPQTAPAGASSGCQIGRGAPASRSASGWMLLTPVVVGIVRFWGVRRRR